MKKGWIWPLVPVVVLGFSVTMHITMITRAATDPTIAVQKNAYERGVRWDRQLEQRRANRELGWTIEVATAPSGTMTATLRTANGQPVTDASINVELFHHARASKIVYRDMTNAGDGTYTIDLPEKRRGFWRFFFEVKQGDITFTQVVNHFAALPPRVPMAQRR